MLTKKRAQAALDLRFEPNTNASRFRPIEEFDKVPTYILDVPETIPQMGYGTHQFFRYYGKFPSIVGREIIARFAKPGAYILDCYAGSGTTLVEAQIAGNPSFGVDINPLAVLASNVKTRYYKVPSLITAYSDLCRSIEKNGHDIVLPITDPKSGKWFTQDAWKDLSSIRSSLLRFDRSPELDFLLIAFLSIIRRTSNAFDGEVRPHVNPQKKPRPPLQALDDKFQDMIAGIEELDAMRPTGIPSFSEIGDNRNVSTYDCLRDQHADLVLAHPPYLNSFNYLQVFGLEFVWSQGFESIWQGWHERDIKALEHRAWPATDERIRANYYTDFRSAMQTILSVLAPDGVVAVIVGDATIYGRLEAVHKHFWDSMKQLGMKPIEVWFRTTHYGIGKYAYRDRADYHGDAEKRDAIMFFRQS